MEGNEYNAEGSASLEVSIIKRNMDLIEYPLRTQFKLCIETHTRNLPPDL